MTGVRERTSIPQTTASIIRIDVSRENSLTIKPVIQSTSIPIWAKAVLSKGKYKDRK